jgi:hypothetical protein
MSSHIKGIKWRRQAECNDATTQMRVGNKERFADAVLNRMKKQKKKNRTNNLRRRLVGSRDDHVMFFDGNVAESHSSKRENLKKCCKDAQYSHGYINPVRLVDKASTSEGWRPIISVYVYFPHT